MTARRIAFTVFTPTFWVTVPTSPWFSFLGRETTKHSWCDQRSRERGDKWSMSVSEWAEQMPLLFWSLKTHWEQSTLYLQSPLQSQHGGAWHKGQQPCDRPGSGQGQGGGTDTSRLPRHNAVISTFPPPMRVANDSTQSPKQGKAVRYCSDHFTLTWCLHLQ